jgi:hypothetical protein
MTIIKAPCSVEGCDTGTYARTWCWKHYQRWRRYGDVLTVRKKGGEGQLGFDHAEYRVSYFTSHQWINRNFPRVGRCEYCAATSRATHYACARHIYTRNRADWFELCVPCHRTFDRSALRGCGL